MTNIPATVTAFGAVGDGVADDVLAFEAAAAASLDISVPTGTYHLSRVVNVSGRNIMWRLAQDATIVEGASWLNGGIIRPTRINRQTWGTWAEGAVFGISGQAGDTLPGVTGFITDSQQATYPTRDSVALYVDNAVPPAMFSSAAGATYTATTCVNTAAATQTTLLIDMVIVTRHTPFYTGRMTGWSADGKTFTVSGWYAQGNTAPGQVPANGVAFDIIRASAAWAANFNVLLNANSYANVGATAVGLEIGTFQNFAAYNQATQLPNLTGIDVVDLGKYGSQTAYLQRGQHNLGFASSGSRGAAYFIYDNTSLANGPYPGPAAGFQCNAVCVPFFYAPKGIPTWQVASNGLMDIGNTSVGGPVGLDLHILPDNYLAPRDYDIRLIGTANGAGGSDFFVLGAGAVHLPSVMPATDNVFNLGASAARWANLFLTGSIITTSDRREKSAIQPIDPVLATRLVQAIPACSYRRTARSPDAEPGADMQRHFGWVAQDVQAATQAAGLSETDFGGVMVDAETGRLGMRNDEMTALLWAALQQALVRLDALEAGSR